MAILEDLDEGERYLWAILQDHSGIDLAEFALTDENNKDSCFRCWPYQYAWWRDNSPLQVDQCARAVGKSLSIKLRAFIFPFLFPGQEMIITGPEGVHVEAITDLIETTFLSSRLGAEMLIHGRSGIKHKPFHMNFSNGARIMGRIPQHDGRGVKGAHPIWLELDEAQNYPEAGWVELIETLKRGFEGATWRAHGVTRGLRDKFFEFTDDTNPDNRWKVHRITAMSRPNWTDEERQEKIRAYGSKDDPDYRRNVLGAHGDASQALFVLHRLMRIVDDDKTSDYNTDEYYHVTVTDEMLNDAGGNILALVDFPQRHIADYMRKDRGKPQRARYFVGADIGFTRDPTEILVCVEHVPTTRLDRASGKKVAIPKDEQVPVLRLLTRISLKRVKAFDQMLLMKWVIDFYRPAAFSMDSTGVGLPIFQLLQNDNKQVATVVKGYNFSQKLLVDFDQTIEVDEYHGDLVKDAGIIKNVLEHATDKLRELVDVQRLYLPWDKNLIGQFQGATVTARKSGQDQYGRTRVFSGGEDHCLDAFRMLVMGYVQEFIEEFMNEDRQEAVLDQFIF